MFFHKTIIAGDTSAREQKSIRYCTRVFSNFVKGRINFRVWCAFMLSAAIFEFEFFTTYCRCSFTSLTRYTCYMYTIDSFKYNFCFVKKNLSHWSIDPGSYHYSSKLVFILHRHTLWNNRWFEFEITKIYRIDYFSL